MSEHDQDLARNESSGNAAATRGDASARRPRGTSLFLWLAMWLVMAVAIALGATVAVLYQGQNKDRDAAAEVRRMLEARLASVQKQLAGVQEQLAKAQKDLDAQREKSAKADLDFQKLLADARLEGEKQKAQAVSDLQRQNADLLVAMKQRQMELRTANDDLNVVRERLDLSAKQLADANAIDSMKLAAAAQEILTLRKLHDAASAAAGKARESVEEMRARQVMLWGDFQTAYLAAAAPGESGFKAFQTAAARSGIVARCGKCRQAAKADAMRRLLEKLEVVLTRLQLLEAGNFDAENSFRVVLNDSGVMALLEASLSSPPETAELRSLLVEAKAILSGAEHAN